ncbi:MAG: sirohydrochlorin cobaltochelatase [Desulforhopalus sp.]
MKIPTIMVAFGTTSKAMATYTHLDTYLRGHFPGQEIFWSYSSRVITRRLQELENQHVIHPEELLQKLTARGVEKAVVQSLHLFPGTEFHNLHHLSQNSDIDCSSGMPILTSPMDYDEVGELFRPLISARPEQAILVLGHGSVHPTWTAYYSLEKLLRQKFHKEIHVGVVEKYPKSDHLVDEIADSGITKVCIIPLFLVTGLHYRRDIMGEGAQSWKSRLQRRNIAVEAIDCGLGLYPGFEQLVIRHILEARKAFTS